MFNDLHTRFGTKGEEKYTHKIVKARERIKSGLNHVWRIKNVDGRFLT